MPAPRARDTGQPWTAERLRSWIEAFYGQESIVVLANREPVRHDRAADGRIVATRSASGLVTALEPLMHASSGVWVAHGAGTADRLVVDGRDGLDVPPASRSYRLRRVWLEPSEERGYYYGFANEGLWPFCHRTRVRPVFRADDFRHYRLVNARFADAVGQEVDTESPLVLVQDYHFALAPQMIRQRLPLSTIVAFWHIPWPNPIDAEVCPWTRELVEGLLGSSIVGFQTPEDCQNFIETVASTLDAEINRTRNVIDYAGHRTRVRAYPVSVEWPSRWAGACPSIATCRELVGHQLRLGPHFLLGVGIDRLDYTKGLNEKLLAVELLLQTQPALRGRFVFVQIAEPSRSRLPAYRELRSELVQTAARINRRFGTESYRPVILLEAHHEPGEVFQFLRAADFCYVGSLHDGMNLVAKEFVSARDDNRGVLILSEFAGAARELTDALLVTPNDIADGVRALVDAVRMPEEEQSRRMRAMRTVVAEFNAYRWAGQMLADATRLRRLSIGWGTLWRSGQRAVTDHSGTLDVRPAPDGTGQDLPVDSTKPIERWMGL